MEEVSTVSAGSPESVGETLRALRDRQGLSLGEIAARTRVPQRHLEAIERGDYNGLPSHTYATGFVKAYARAVGGDEVALTRQLRGELAHAGPRPAEYRPYEAPDPARVPSRGLTVVTLGVALAIIVLAGLWYGGVLQQGATPVATTPAAEPAAAPTQAAATAPPAATGGQVALQVTDRVWLRVHDGDRTLYEATMNPGERYDVPADAQNPLVDVGRPDKLQVTLNGAALPSLAASSRPVTNLRVGAAAVAARLNGTTAPPAADTAPVPAAAPQRAPAPRPLAARAASDETARANLDAAAPPAAGNAQ